MGIAAFLRYYGTDASALAGIHTLSFCLLTRSVQLAREDELDGSFDIPARGPQCSDILLRIPQSLVHQL